MVFSSLRGSSFSQKLYIYLFARRASTSRYRTTCVRNRGSVNSVLIHSLCSGKDTLCPIPHPRK